MNKRHRLNLIWALSLFISSAILPVLMACSAYGEDLVVVLNNEVAYIDTVVVVETETPYVITTTTGPRTEVVDSVTVERVAWVDSWIILYRGGSPETRTVISQDDDSNSTTNNFWASRLSGIATPDTYTIRATSFEYVTANQRPVGTYTLSSNLIPPVVETPTVVVVPVVEPSPVPTPSPSPLPTPTPQPVQEQIQGPIYIPSIEVSTPIQELPVVEPLLEQPPIIEPEVVQPIIDSAPVEPTPLEELPPIEVIDPELPVIVETLETSEVLENVFNDGNITPADVEAVVDSYMADGLVTEAEATELIETLTDSGVLSESEENLILEVLSADGEITQDEVNNLSETLSENGQFTTAERELVAEALIESAEGQAVTVESIAEAGIALADLPPATPVELRQDENGNDVIITAVIADALQLLESPAAILEAIFESPAQLVFALGNLGADMSEEERDEATKTIVAATIVANIAANAAVTASIGAVGYRRKP